MWYSNECKLVLIAYLWSCLIILKVKTENHKHFQNCIVEGTGSSLWDNIQDITESELGLLALILLPVLPSFIHDFRFTFVWPFHNGCTLWDYGRPSEKDTFVCEVFPLYKLQFMNVCRLHPCRLVFHQQASAKWWKIAGKLLFPLQKIFILEDYVYKKSIRIECH